QHAAHRQRPARQARPDLRSGQDASADRILGDHRLWLDLVDAVDAHDLFNEIRLAIDVRTPRRNIDVNDITLPLRLKAKAAQDCEALLRGDFDARQALHFRNRKGHDLLLSRLEAYRMNLAWLAAAEVQH